jgi:hypothetical protein
MDDVSWNRLQTYALPIPGPSKCEIIAEVVLTLSWVVLFETVAKVCMTHSRIIQIYNYSWDGADIVTDDAIWNCLQKYTWPTPAPSKCMLTAETVLTLSWTMLFKIVCKSMQGPFQDHLNLWLWLKQCLIVMDDAIWNRLQKYACPTPGPSKSVIIAEMVLALSWVMLFEIGCKCLHNELQDHQNLWL